MNEILMLRKEKSPIFNYFFKREKKIKTTITRQLIQNWLVQASWHQNYRAGPNPISTQVL